MTIHRRLNLMYLVAVDRHLERVFISNDLDAAHCRFNLAVAVGAHATARAVAQVLRTFHRARHAGRMQDALAAVATAEKPLLGEVFNRLDHPLNTTITDPRNLGMERPGCPLGDLVGSFEQSRTVERKHLS